MRTTHISTVHRPLDTRIFEKECHTLAGAGYEVHLVCGCPPAPRIDGIQLHAVASTNTRPRAREQWMRQWRAARHAFRLRPSVFHLHDPHLVPLGLLLKALGSTVIYDVHEDYPAHARTKLAHRPLRGGVKALMWRLLEGLARRRFDGFVCASSALARSFPAGRTTTVTNYPRLFEIEGNPGDGVWRQYRDRPNVVIYVGVATEPRGWWQMARAMERLPEELGARFVVVGQFPGRELEQAARADSSWKGIEFEAWRAHPLVARALDGARVGLIILQPHPNHWDADRSNKLFEYMAAGLPVVAPDFPRWREIVAGADCGLLVDPADTEAVAEAIEYLLTHPEEAEAMGRRGRAAVTERFTWDQQAELLLACYRTLVGSPRTPDREPILETDMAV